MEQTHLVSIENLLRIPNPL